MDCKTLEHGDMGIPQKNALCGDTKTFVGSCYMGVNREKTNYVLLQFAKEVTKGFSFIYPPILFFSHEEMSKNGLSLILSNLRNRPTLVSASTPEIPREELLKIKRTHPLVDIELLRTNNGEEIKLMPLHARRGWAFDVETEEIRYHSLPMTNESFMKALDEALEAAT